jgi:hypothetical protein
MGRYFPFHLSDGPTDLRVFSRVNELTFGVFWMLDNSIKVTPKVVIALETSSDLKLVV